jgi:predicted nucleotidyltransferase component of viral defense system
MLKRYDFTLNDPYEALREILQEIVLYALYDAGFFHRAVFYGGTALRMLYGLPRFSEDLDFSLLESQADFDLAPYAELVQRRLKEYGFEVQIETKAGNSAIRSGFVKANTLKSLLAIEVPETLLRDYHPGKRG